MCCIAPGQSERGRGAGAALGQPVSDLEHATHLRSSPVSAARKPTKVEARSGLTLSDSNEWMLPYATLTVTDPSN